MMENDLVNRALPTGAVTLLLTDLEGSTPMWDASEAIAAVAVERHRELLYAAIETRGGVRPEEQGEGDSVVAAFTNPSDALAAAFDAQRAFASETWPTPLPLRVRMALHTGVVSVRDERNYQGPTIIRAARLRGLAHGGQVLCSESLHDLVVDLLPEAASLRDMGVHRLKGLGRPEHVWQLCHPDLDDEFPPLVSPDAIANNIPLLLTGIVGRESDIATVRAAVAEHRLVTLIGAGGCGKSRLALQVATESVRDGAGCVWWVELAPVSDAGRVTKAIADAIGVHESHDQPLLEILASELRGRDALLLIDNCEHVLDETARLVDALLSTVPDLRVLATSREPFGMAGELSWRVPSLTEASAVDLFVQRARAVRPGFAPEDDDRAAVAAICRRVDGLPLAVELAAARVRMMHPRRIAAGLDDCFRLLTGGSRTAMARQQTLEASIAWSHDLLDPHERALLRRLSVFAGGFTVAAAEAVAADDDIDAYGVLDLLTRLVDKSLVYVEDERDDVRYRMLETIRQFAAARLVEAGETDAVRARHLAHFLECAEGSQDDLVRADGVALLTRFEDEHANYRAALDWAERADDATLLLRLATALTLFWELRGHTGEGCQWFERALARPSEPTIVRARALWGAAHVALYHDEEETARELARAALDLAIAVDDRWTEARALNTIGYGETLWPERHDAREVLERSIALGRTLGDEWVVADGLKMLSLGFMFREDFAGTTRVVDELRAVATGLGNEFFLAWCDAAIAMVALHRGDFEWARARLEASIARCKVVGDPSTAGIAIAYLGELEASTGQTATARTRLDTFIAHANAQGSHIGLAPAVTVLLELMLAGGEYEYLDIVAAGFVDGVSFPTLRACGGVVLGRALLEHGDVDGARAALDAALTAAEQAENPWAIAKVQHARGLVAHAAGEPRAAEDLLHAALALRHGCGLAPGVAESLEALATTAADEESYDEATRLLAASAALRDRLGGVLQAAECVRYESARDRLERALGKAEFAAAWSDGESLTADDAVAYATRARRERKRPSSGWSSLTPTEERVVALVAEGLTNPQIAERLFVAPGTIKVHVSHVFTKLGLSTRSELAAAAARRETRSVV